jgi:hypothetical protein
VSLNTVTLTLDAYAGDGDPITQGTAFLVPSELLVDTTDHKTVFQTPVTVALEPPEDASEGWLPTVELFSCDSSNLSPSGWLWEISFEGMSGAPAPYSFALDYSNGADQYLSAQTPVAAAPSSPTQYLPQPTGSQLLGFVPVSLGGSAESEWFPGPGLPPSGDSTGASDTVNIQNLLNLTGQAQLQYGVFEVNGPFVPPSGKQLWVRGYKGGTQSGAGAGNNIGTVVKAVAGWTGTGLPVTAMFSVLYGNGTTNTAINEALDLRDLWIDLSAGPANVDAIASWGAMHGLVMQERAERQRQHLLAMEAGRRDPGVQFASPPPNRETVLIHMVEDGLTAFGVVWFRGQELEIEVNGPRWSEARKWILLDDAQQMLRWKKIMFRRGPWPGLRSYRGAQFMPLRAMSGEGALAPITPDALMQADAAEARRGRGIPVLPRA